MSLSSIAGYLVPAAGILLALILGYVLLRFLIKGIISTIKFAFYGFVLLSVLVAGALAWWVYIK